MWKFFKRIVTIISTAITFIVVPIFLLKKKQ